MSSLSLLILSLLGCMIKCLQGNCEKNRLQLSAADRQQRMRRTDGRETRREVAHSSMRTMRTMRFVGDGGRGGGWAKGRILPICTAPQLKLFTALVCRRRRRRFQLTSSGAISHQSRGWLRVMVAVALIRTDVTCAGLYCCTLSGGAGVVERRARKPRREDVVPRAHTHACVSALLFVILNISQYSVRN